MNLCPAIIILWSTIIIPILMNLPKCSANPGQGGNGQQGGGGQQGGSGQGQHGPLPEKQPTSCSKMLDFDFDGCVNDTALMIRIHSVQYCTNTSYPICLFSRNYTFITNEPFTSIFFPGMFILKF